MTIAQLEANMTAAEFMEWVAFMRLDPFGSEREDWRSAQICAVVANAVGGAKTKVRDFMLNGNEPVPFKEAGKALSEYFGRPVNGTK